jgi:hypothetical protein
VSADFWHETRAEIRSRLGKDLFVFAQCGAAGDQSPHFLLYKNVEADMRTRAGISERQEIAERIAHAVERAARGADSAVLTDAEFGHTVRTLPLSPRVVTPAEHERMKKDLAALDPTTTTAERKTARLQKAIAEYEQGGKSSPYEIELHVLRIGDVAMATNPFELYLDYGLRIKARSAAAQTFAVQLCAGSGGYLPTAKALRGGHYGAQPMENRVGPEGGQELVEETLAVIEAMWR